MPLPSDLGVACYRGRPPNPVGPGNPSLLAEPGPTPFRHVRVETRAAEDFTHQSREKRFRATRAFARAAALLQAACSGPK
jgi:hypothetical protein